MRQAKQATGIFIRQALLRDAQTITEFNALIAQETEHRTLDENVLRRGVEAILNDPSRGVYYVAEHDGNVVGQLMITYEWSDWRNGDFWWIQSVYVKERFRKQGIFTALFDFVKGRAKTSKSVSGLRLYVDGDNIRAQRTYKKLGMKKTRYEMFEIDFVL